MATLISGLGGTAGFGEQSMKSLGVTSGNQDDGSRFVDTSSVFGTSGINIGGTTYSGFYLNTNGNLTFASPLISTAGISNNLLTDAPNQPMISAFWTDIDITKGGDIYWDLDPTSGKVTITWSNVASYASTGNNSFQIVLTNHGSGNVSVDFIYDNIGFTAGNGIYTATVGISNGTTQILAEGSGDASLLSSYGSNNFDTGDPNGVFGTDLQGGTPTVSINGTAGNDTLNGTTASDLVYGGAGNDSINGGGGNDTLNGDTGNDTLNAGAGNDSLSGGDGDDRFVLANGFGNDTIIGGEAGEVTGDVIDASAITANTSIIFTADETGTITDGTSTATFSQIEGISTGSGNNTVNAGATTNGVNIEAGAGEDVLTGGSGADTLAGGAGNDSLAGGAGNDNLAGGSGNDIFDGGAGNDLLAGNDGDDRFVLNNTSDNDTIVGGETGEVAGDTMDGSAVSANVTVIFSGNETGTASAGGSTVSFSQIENFVSGSGDDNFNATAATTSSVNFSAGAGNDTISGGGGNDTIQAGSGNDVVQAGLGADSVTGGIGNDQIGGGAGNDILQGDAGNDTLTGGSGIDQMTGGADSDTFVLLEADSGDTITDFDLTLQSGRTMDQLDISDLVDANGDPVRAWQVQVTDNGSGHALLTFPSGETLTLQGIAPAAILGAGKLNSMGVPCFGSGSRIACPDGCRAIEDLRPGDLVLTEDDGPQPVQWTGRVSLRPEDLQDRPNLRPILFPAGSLGNHRDVLLSPQHAVAVPGQEILTRARHLVGRFHGVRVARGKKSVTYHHILLPCHAILSCEGLRAESLYPGPMTEQMFSWPDRLSLSLAIAQLRGVDSIPAAGLAAIYGPRCRPLAPRPSVILPHRRVE